VIQAGDAGAFGPARDEIADVPHQGQPGGRQRDETDADQAGQHERSAAGLTNSGDPHQTARQELDKLRLQEAQAADKTAERECSHRSDAERDDAAHQRQDDEWEPRRE
jgi:hypothetical protein